MLTNADVMKFLAVWELVHETADEGLKAAIARGQDTTPGDMKTDSGSFVDGLAAMVDSKKDAIKLQLAAGTDDALAERDGALSREIADLRFEVAELRGRIESMHAALDALAAIPDRA
ncbi:MAG: hypothetical protein LBS17_04720 [Actinomycetes bacterium]|jgi:uncharacterized protein YceH (UPF0502 family)|nr:hypothetical protein [Actinomycetes bacterium]